MTSEERAALIAQLRQLPDQLDELVSGLSETQLTTHFLKDEWTVAQNVHHLADSHMNSYIRCKLIASEDNPTLKPYDQDIWASLPDASSAELGTSMALLRGLHTRWASFFANLPGDAWQRTGMHPENGVVYLEGLLATYVAHGHGHLDQITRTLAAQG